MVGFDDAGRDMLRGEVGSFAQSDEYTCKL
jgi:hypothetical protein